MAKFSPQFIDELTTRADLAQVISRYTKLSNRGDRLWGLCPFHGEKTASFTVSPDKQVYYCFGCGKGGGVIQFIMDIERLEFKEAVEFLAEMYNMELPQQENEKLVSIRKRILDANRLAARFFHEQLMAQQGGEVVEYVRRRGLTAATLRKFGIGYAPADFSLINYLKSKGFQDYELVEGGLAKRGERGIYGAFRHRLMFPIINVKGDVIGFGGRILNSDGKGPKYLNTGENPVFYKKSNLFAYQMAKKSKSNRILLAEGYMDVVSLHQAGFDYAVASLGTALTEEQAKMLAKTAEEIIIAYDTDAAGTAATERAVKILSQVTDKTVRILRVPGGKDPDEFIRTNGAEAFERVLQKSEEQMDYRLASLKVGADMKNDEDRIGYIRNAAKILSELGSKIELEVYAGRVAEAAGVTRDAVIAEVESIRKKRVRAEQKKQHADDISIERQLQPPRDLGVRYENPTAARAEEDLIALVAEYPDLANAAEANVRIEDFT
ncbi:MAG: DNA primase, partial [Clostridia bacterium]|nr:DNA primase [Clostridia bacterium]